MHIREIALSEYPSTCTRTKTRRSLIVLCKGPYQREEILTHYDAPFIHHARSSFSAYFWPVSLLYLMRLN